MSSFDSLKEIQNALANDELDDEEDDEEDEDEEDEEDDDEDEEDEFLKTCHSSKDDLIDSIRFEFRRNYPSFEEDLMKKYEYICNAKSNGAVIRAKDSIKYLTTEFGWRKDKILLLHSDLQKFNQFSEDFQKEKQATQKEYEKMLKEAREFRLYHSI